MYDFELKIKVPFLYELTYEDVVKDNDRDGVYDRKLIKTEKFATWETLRDFAYSLKDKKIIQAVEVKDRTKFVLQDKHSTE